MNTFSTHRISSILIAIVVSSLMMFAGPWSAFGVVATAIAPAESLAQTSLLERLRGAQADSTGAQAAEVLNALLKERYERGFPYAFAYFDEADSVAWAFILEEDKQQRKLRAKRALYVVVVSAFDGDVPQRSQIIASLEPFRARRGAGESIVPKLLGAIAGKGGDVSSQQDAKDSTKELDLSYLMRVGSTTLWTADHKFDLIDNASYRIAFVNQLKAGDKAGAAKPDSKESAVVAAPVEAAPPTPKVLIAPRATVQRFANASGDRFGASLGTTWTFPRTKDDAVSYRALSRVVFDPVIFFHLFLGQESTPGFPGRSSILNRPSLALTGGVKIGEKPFETLFFGVSLGHLLGPVGLDFGVNLRPQRPDSTSSEYWKGRFALGVHYGL